MTVDDLKKILDASPDGGAEVLISGFRHEYEPESIEYVMTYEIGDIWIVANVVTTHELRSNKKARE